MVVTDQGSESISPWSWCGSCLYLPHLRQGEPRDRPLPSRTTESQAGWASKIVRISVIANTWSEFPAGFPRFLLFRWRVVDLAGLLPSHLGLQASPLTMLDPVGRSLWASPGLIWCNEPACVSQEMIPGELDGTLNRNGEPHSRD